MADNINVLVNLIARAQGVGAATKAMTGLQASAVGAEKASANLGRTAIGSKQAFASITNQMRATARPMGDVSSLMTSMASSGVRLNQVSTDTATAFRSIRNQMAGAGRPMLETAGAMSHLTQASQRAAEGTARAAQTALNQQASTVRASQALWGRYTAAAQSAINQQSANVRASSSLWARYEAAGEKALTSSVRNLTQSAQAATRLESQKQATIAATVAQRAKAEAETTRLHVAGEKQRLASSKQWATAETALHADRVRRRRQADAAAAASWDKEFRALEKATSAQNDFNDITARYANYDMAGTLLTVAAAVTALGAATAVAFAVQERAFTEVERILSFDDVSTEGIQNLRGELMALSEEIPVAFSDLSEIAAFGAALDIGAADLDEFSDTVARFSAVTGASTELAGKGLARLAQYTRESTPSLQDATRFEQLGSAILLLGNSSIATEEEVLKFSQSISPLGIRSGVAADQIVAMAAATASFASINVEGAGSAFSRVFANIDRDVAEGGASLESFADIAGTTAGQFQAMWAEDAGGAFNDVIRGLSQDVPNLTTNLDALGIRNERDRRVVQALAANYDEYARYLGMSNDAMVEGTALGQAYSFVADDLASKWQIFLNVLQNTASQVGAVLAPAFSGFLSVVTTVFNAIGDFASSPFGAWVVQVGGAVLGMVAAWAAWRGMIALATAGALAFQTATAFMGGPGIARGAQGLVAAITGTGMAAQAATPKVAAFGAASAAAGGTAGVGRLRSGLAGVVSFLGGPWGLYLGLGAAAIATFIADSQAHVRAGRDQIIKDLSDIQDASKFDLESLFSFSGEGIEPPGVNHWFDDAASQARVFQRAMEDADVVLRNLGDEGGLGRIQSGLRLSNQDATLFATSLKSVRDVMSQAFEGGQGVAALQGLSEVTGLADQDLRTFVAGLDSSFIPQLQKAAEQIGINTNRHDWFNLLLDETALKAEAAGDGATVMSEEFAAAEADAAALQETVDGLIETLEGVSTTSGGVQGSLDDLGSVLNKSGGAIDEFWKNGGTVADLMSGELTPAAIDLRNYFRELNDAGLVAASGILQAGGTVEEAGGAFAMARGEIVDLLTEMGVAPEVAQAWADTMLVGFENVLGIIEETGEAVVDLNGEQITIKFDAETEEFYNADTGARITLEELNKATAAPEIDADPQKFNDKNEKVNQKLTTTGGRTVSPTTDLNKDPFDGSMRLVKADLSGIDKRRVAAIVDANGNILDVLTSATSRLNALDGRHVQTSVGVSVQYSSPVMDPINAFNNGLANGGYTGPGGKYTPAGIVHKGEYVIPKKDVNQATGLPYADALGKLQRGAEGPSYASGGYVNPSVNFPAALALTPGTIQQIAQAVQHLTVLDSRDIARAANRGNSTFKQTGAY